jgi:hypothetical protein
LRETNRHDEAMVYVNKLREKGRMAALVTHSMYLSTRTAGVYFETTKPLKAPKMVECWYMLTLNFREVPTNLLSKLPVGSVLECSFENLHKVRILLSSVCVCTLLNLRASASSPLVSVWGVWVFSFFPSSLILMCLSCCVFFFFF